LCLVMTSSTCNAIPDCFWWSILIIANWCFICLH
jgi:hypothetical protein